MVPSDWDEVTKGFDNPHRAQRVGYHQPGELIGRDVCAGRPMLVGHASVDEEEVELPSTEPFTQGFKLFGNVDVEVFDLEVPARRFRQLVERSAIRTTDGGYNLRTSIDVLLRYRQAQAARGTDDEDGRLLRGRCHL